jgi:hypothetical protein
MPRPLPKVPEFEVSPALVDHPYYAPAVELVRRIRQKSELNDDEIVILALVAAQAALAKYLEPNSATAEETVRAFLSVLDHEEVVTAALLKMHRMLREQLA